MLPTNLLSMWRSIVLFVAGTQLRRYTLLTAFVLSLAMFGTWYLWFRESQPTCSGEFDLVIAGAEIVDGLGSPIFKADVGIRNKRIACIGTIDLAGSPNVIDAEGLTLAPGFIDVHTHVERNVPESATPFLAPNFVRQGVTTVITGNCGRSFLDIGKLFRGLEGNGSQVNLASLVGHNTVRLQVMKETPVSSTPQQLERMKVLVKSAMQDGAVGLSTGLEYIPGTFADANELVELARIAGDFDGIYASHIRNEAVEGEAAIREAISIGERAHVPVEISHFKAQGPNQWGSAQRRLNLVSAANARGQAVSMDQYPYTASSTGISVLLPSWVSGGGISAARRRLGDPATHKRVRNEMLTQLRDLGWKDYSFARVAYYQFDHSLVGLTIPEIAHKLANIQSGKTNSIFTQARFGSASRGWQNSNESELERQAEAIIDIFLHGGAQMVFLDMDQQDVEAIMSAPNVMFGSDSGVREGNSNSLPHPRGLGTFPRILGLYARDRHLFSVEEAIRRMTSLPAATFSLKDRGEVREGYWADLVLFNRDRIRDRATFEEPLEPPEGIYYVIVNGSLVIDRGSITRVMPGLPIRHVD